MSKKSSYQKLKDEILSLKRELITVCTTDGVDAISIKTKYKILKQQENAIWNGNTSRNTNVFSGIINSMQNIQA